MTDQRGPRARVRRVVAALVVATAIVVAAPSGVAAGGLDDACRAQLGRRLAAWTVTSVPDDVAAWARAHKFDPTVARGDFDGDGRADVAFLVQARSQPLREYPERLVASRLAVCLARPSGVVLHLLDQLYCGDYIEAVAKGERYYDFERDRKGVYPSDGVKTVCFEHASATYVYDGGAFRRIVDGD